MIIAKKVKLSLLSLLMLSACASPSVSSCQLPALPAEIMAPPKQESLLAKMESLLPPSSTLPQKAKATGSN